MLTLDAPVSGGVGGATAGTLTFMCGGSPEAFAKAKPMLEAMGKRIVHCGGAGAGQAAKICNNMILGATMIATCEAFALAEKLGLSAQALFDVASTSSGQSWSLTNYCPVPGPVPNSPANRGYKPGFAASLMLKDLRLAQEAAASVGAVDPAWGRSRAALRPVCRGGPWRGRLFRGDQLLARREPLDLSRHSWTGRRIEIVRHKRRGPPWTASPRRAKERSALNQFPAHPCFRMSARPAAVKLAEKNHLFFIVLSKAQPLASRRDEANEQGIRTG